MDVELQATCSALGYLEDGEYVKEPDCIETVKDLIRFLRRDTDVCDIRRQLGNAQILQTDLIPLVKTYHGEKELFDTVIKLLVNLTQPVLACFNNEIPDEKTLRNNCLEVEGYLQDYKEAFIDEDLFAVLATKIQDILKMNWDERREEDRLQLERLLVLVRNVLMVPADVNREQRTEDDASTHDQVLWMLHTSGLEDMILYMASSDRERSHLCMHVLEIIALMFKEQEPETLASAGVQRSLTVKEKDQKELEQAREREKIQKKANILKYSARHSRFGGTFVLKDVKSISESDVIYHKPLCEVKRFTYDDGKNKKKISKNRAPIKTDDLKRRSTLSMRLSLKEFCVQFLINAYNPLMREVKDGLTRKSAQDNDETYYLWAMRFFMEFCRLHCKRVDLISETMSMSAFHYMYTQLMTYYENIRMLKAEERKIWGRRSHLAVKAYQELLRTLDFMSRFSDEQIQESARVIQSNVFYMMEYRDVFVVLLKNFKESCYSRAYLRDLVESTHLFLKMLEVFTKRNKNLVVQRKKKKKGGRKKKAAQPAPSDDHTEPPQEELEATWSEGISAGVSACLQGRAEIPEDVAPFDAASEVDIDEQRMEAMLRIQTVLRDNQPGMAVALFRAAREVWPEHDAFGTSDMGEEEEFMALREVFMASLPRPQTQPTQPEMGEEFGEEFGYNEEVEEEVSAMQASEAHFDFNHFIADFAHLNVLKSYSILLREFTQNSDTVNHCVVKMLHRVGHDLGFVGMLFQASIFTSFNSIINGPYAKLARFKELSKFACYVVRQFTQVASLNKKIFVDMMFWKNRNEAIAITSGYDFTTKSKGVQLWNEHQEDELQGLWDKFKDVRHPELDTVDLIMGELTSNHTRLQVIKELKRQKAITSAKDLKRPGKSHKWSEDEVQELNILFEQYKDSNYPLKDILEGLTKKRSRQSVVTKILELGLVSDRSELLKKRRGGKNRRRNKGGEDSDEGDMLFPESGRGRGRNSSDSESESSGGGSSDEDNASDDNNDKNNNGTVDESTTPAVTSVAECVVKVVEQGYREPLAWIIRNLRNAAEDRDEGICQPTPIVPLSDENETAMEDESFLVLLRLIGISEPASQQELFWRIPAQYTSRDLNTIADGLELTESGDATDGESVQTIVRNVFPLLPSSSSRASSGGKQKKEKKKKKKKDKDGKKKKKSGGSKKPRNPEMLQNDGEVEEFDLRMPQGYHSTDTSDSGLDSEIEAKEQFNLWMEKNRGKKTFAADRKAALMRMMEHRNNKRGRVAHRPPKGKAKTTAEKGDNSSDESDDEETTVTSNKVENGAVNASQGSNGSAKKSPSSSKKRLIQTTNSDSDSNTSSLSSLSEAEDGDKGDNEDDDEESPKKVISLPGSHSKKRLLDSDSDSDVPLATEPHKRQKKRAPVADEDVSGDKDNHQGETSDKSGGSDKENKESENLDESMRLFLPLSDDEDGKKESDDGQKKDEDEDQDMQSDSNEVKEKSSAKGTESFPATLLTQGVDSDDEDDHVTLKSAVKRRRAVIEDSDDD